MSEEAAMDAYDDRLTDELRALANRVDPPPDLLGELARAAFGWRSIDAQLAELTYDSAVDESLAQAVRGPARTTRLLTFDAAGITVEVEVTVQGEQRRLMGQIVPMQPMVVEIRHSGGVTPAESDELGRFAADGLPWGPVSLRCHVAAGDEARVVHTDWATI